MPSSEWVRDYFKGDREHDAVEVWAILDRADAQGRTERLLRTTLIYAVEELRKLTVNDMGPNIATATDLEYLVWDLICDAEKRRRWHIAGFEMRYTYMDR
jgi:hypothetical protein